ncbi:MAG TPA: hypothetical protein VLY24_07300 [Bryobacteraceae bacterium]|nr:hypothetical protein [Bryobacteraceae bacterium]
MTLLTLNLVNGNGGALRVRRAFGFTRPGQVQQRLAGEFGHRRIGVAQKRDQHPNPAQFRGLKSNHRYG